MTAAEEEVAAMVANVVRERKLRILGNERLGRI
jgi:hypothetical protein